MRWPVARQLATSVPSATADCVTYRRRFRLTSRVRRRLSVAMRFSDCAAPGINVMRLDRNSLRSRWPCPNHAPIRRLLRLRRLDAATHELTELVREGRISTLFQPIVDPRSRGVCGFEALTRGPSDSWLHSPQNLFEAARRERRQGAARLPLHPERIQALRGRARRRPAVRQRVARHDLRRAELRQRASSSTRRRSACRPIAASSS